MRYGLRYLSALIQRPDPAEASLLPRIGHLFVNDEEAVYEVVRDHMARYGEPPNPKTVSAKTGKRLPKIREAPAYYRDQMIQRYVDLRLRKAADRANALLENRDPLTTLDAQLEDLMGIRTNLEFESLVDYREAGGYLVSAYAAQQTRLRRGVEFGWPTLDRMSSGVQIGDLVSIVGRPAMGKTWMLVWLALYAWAKQERPVLFVSMEMNPLVISQRLASVQFSTPIRQIMRAAIPKGKQFGSQWEGFRKGLRELRTRKAPLWILDGNMAATPEQIAVLARHLRPEIILVDGAYLLQHPDPRLHAHAKVAENTHALKRIASQIAPVVATWQFNRDAVKLKEGERPGLEHIADSDAIGKDSALVLALFEDESPETIVRRQVSILKGRQGERGSYLIRWDFKGMEFGETKAEEGELAYL